MTIRGILFDIGDTLIGATELQQRVLTETVRDLPNESWCISSNSFLDAYQEADHEPQFDQIPDLNHLYSDERIVERAFALLSRQFAKTFLEIYRARLYTNLQLDPALIALLTKLRDRGIRLGIVSNGTTREQRDQLEQLGIIGFFDPILISQEVGIRKPEPGIFLIAAERWQLPASEILVVGDRGDWEVLGAQRAGMQSALTTQFVNRLNTVLSKAEPNFLISHFKELLDVMKEEMYER